MLGLEDLEIGLMFWAEEDARKTLRDGQGNSEFAPGSWDFQANYRSTAPPSAGTRP